MTARLHLGTSGFAYDEWKGSLYPRDIKSKDMLAYFATRFTSVEINYTFRRLPSEKTLVAWRAATPDGFTFALKAHMRITHSLDHAASAEAVSKFFEAVAPLGDRTGPILFQFPSNRPFDAARLNAFLDLLPAGHRYVFEPHDASWSAARPLLADRGIAWCVVETDDSAAPDDVLASGPFHYMRLRKTDYKPAELRRWAKRIRAALDAGRDVHCYFKHEDEGKGPRFAQALRRSVTA